MKLNNYIKIFVFILGLFLTTPVFAADLWVTDLADCGSSYMSQTCSGLTPYVCGYNGTTFCADGNFTAPAADRTESSTAVSANGGFKINCYATPDAASPYCDNNGSFTCTQNATCSSKQQTTVCTGGSWGVASCGSCKTGYHDCDGDSANGCSGATEHDGVACTIGGLPGTYLNCVCTPVSATLNLSFDSAIGTYLKNSVLTSPTMTILSSGLIGVGTSTPTTVLTFGANTGNQIDVAGGHIIGLSTTPTEDSEAVPLLYLQNNYAPLGSGEGGIGIGTSGQTLRHDGTSWIADSTLFNNGTNIGIGTTDPTTKLTFGANTGNQIDVSGGHIIGLNAIPVDDYEAVPLKYLQDNFAPISGYNGFLNASNISAGTFASATGGGDFVFTGNLDFPELINARATYDTLNDRINGVATNYSSIITNSEVKSTDFKISTDVNTTNTTAYYNSQLGSIQNDASAWTAISLSYAYGNGRSMGGTLIYGNKMYIGTYGYGIKILNLDSQTLEKQYWTASTPPLPNNYWHHIAYDSDHNDLYAGNNTYSNGMIKIDLDTDTITRFTVATSDILADNMGTSYDNCMNYYNGKVYFWPAGQYMQTYDVNSGVFTQFTAGLPSATCYSTEIYNNELHISTSYGLYIWDMTTDTLIKRYYSNGPQGLYNYTNTTYSSSQDPYDSDIVWVATNNSWQKLSKTNGWQEFHKITDEVPAINTRWSIKRIGDQLWLGSENSGNPYGYLVYDLNAQDYFVMANLGKVIGNAQYTSSYHFKPMYYNGYWYFANYSLGSIYKSQLIYESSNVFESNVLATMTNDITTAKFTYTGGVGAGNNLEWYMSADNGVNWEGPVTPGAIWKFTNTGTQLKVKALMTAAVGTTPIIRGVQVAVYDGETWAGEGSNTVETEVLEARNSAANGLFGSLDLRLEDIDTKITALPNHNHDASYLKLTGGTLLGALTMNANINASHILPKTNNVFDLGAVGNIWANIYSGLVDVNGGMTDVINVNGGRIMGLSMPIERDNAVNLGYLEDNYSVSSNSFWSGVKNVNIWNGDSGVGNVGIGTTNPASKLTLSGGDLEMDHNTSIKISSSTADVTLLFGNYADSLSFSYGTSTQATNKTLSLAIEGDVKANRLCMGDDCKSAWSEITGSGSGAIAVYVGSTATAVNGSNNANPGYDVAYAACDSAYAGSHVCTPHEMLNNVKNGTIYPATNVWIFAGPPGYTASANDCNARAASAAGDLGAYWEASSGSFPKGRGLLMACNQTLKIACCQ